MRKDFDDDFSFLDELEPVKRTKEKKSGSGKKKTRAVLNHKEESKKTVKKSSAKKKAEGEKAESIKAKQSKAPKGERLTKPMKAIKSVKPERSVKASAPKRRKKRKENILLTVWESLYESGIEMGA